MNNKGYIIVFLLLFAFSTNVNAQKGFRLEADVGVPIGAANDYHTIVLQSNLYYLFEVSKDIALGPTSGGLFFLGNVTFFNNTEGYSYSGNIPEAYIPFAIAGRIDLLNVFSIGLDTGYAFKLSGGGGFYFRPVITYNFTEKLAIIGSYSNIYEGGYTQGYEGGFTATSINIGVILGF